MALTRKLLTALGIEADKIDQIIEAHTETVEGLKKERDKYKNDADQLTTVQKELDDEKKKNAGENSYKEMYEKEHKAFEDYKTEVQNKEVLESKKGAFRALLKKAGVSEKRIDAILKITDLESVELDSKGQIKKADELEKNIKEEWADFIETKRQKGADVSNPPENNGGSDNGDELSKLAAQMQANLYGAPPAEK